MNDLGRRWRKSSSVMSVVMLVCSEVGCVWSESDVEAVRVGDHEKRSGTLTKMKLGSIGVLVVAGGVGVSVPLIGKKIAALRPDNDIFFMVKAFAAGVILSTAFVHILPDAFHNFNSPSLIPTHHTFPFAGFVAMLSAIATLMMDTLATGYYERRHFSNTRKPQAVDSIAEDDEEHAGHIHVHTHATHGHSHGSSSSATELLRRRIVSQVLELGIVVHSVIIGISLGACGSVETLKPLLVALSFHQFFEGLGLGGCISQAQFKSTSTVVMATFFSLTAPLGIAIGMAISRIYKEDSREALLVQGVFNAASAGILIYMSLVDLLAADFMNPRLKSNLRLQFGANLSLLLGAASMSLLAKWA